MGYSGVSLAISLIANFGKFPLFLHYAVLSLLLWKKPAETAK